MAERREVAVFGGGCFWCTEAIFKMLKGVHSVLPGYSGGKIAHPSYEDVSAGSTGHAEVVRIEFDPEVITYEDLLTVFFATHDPTTPNRQGNDVGSQYRSMVLFTTPEQKEKAQAYLATIKGAVTEVKSFAKFFEAESYHHDYYNRNRNKPYCQVVINPKLQKVKEKFAALLMEQSA